MKKVLLLGSIFGLLVTLSSQALAQGKIVFEKTSHTFGTIQEDGGKVSVVFEFTNTGEAPIKLTNVKASCGCTTPEWSKDPIAPGKTGKVEAVYNPLNRPGKFNKTISVFTDGEPQYVSLSIAGEVAARQKGIADWYPAKMGNLRMNSRNVYFGKVFHDAQSEKSLVLFNETSQAIEIDLEKSLSTLPAHIEAHASTSTVNPKDSVKISFTFDATKQNDWGYVSNSFNLITNDSEMPSKRIYISSNVVENFGNITDATKVPRIRLDKVNHDFGKINQNTRNTASFTITNDGDAPLIIRKTKASCGCTASRPKKTNLAPGESTTIDVTYSSGTKKGKQRQNVTIISNDPASSVNRINISADILDPAAPEDDSK